MFIVQKNVIIPNWPVSFIELEKILAKAGAELFVKVLTDYVAGKIVPMEQNHSKATFTKKIEKKETVMSIEEKTDFQIELEIEVENSALISSLGLFNSRLKQAYVLKILDENGKYKRLKTGLSLDNEF